MQRWNRFCRIGMIIFILLLSACGKAEPELKQSVAGEAFLQLERIPFSVELQNEQTVTICDIRNSHILGYIGHWNDSHSFVLADQIFVWDMAAQEVERTVEMNQEYLFSAVLDQDGGIYADCADVSDNAGEKWDLHYLGAAQNEFGSLKSGVSTWGEGLGSPQLAHMGDEIVCVYEEKEGSGQGNFGSLILEDGKIKELETVELSEKVKYPAYNAASGKNGFAYPVERGKSLFVRTVKADGEVLEFPWENKGNDFEIVGNYLIQSGQGETDGQYVIRIYDMETGDQERYRVKSHGLRMQAAGEDSFYSVDSYFNIFRTELGADGVEETLLEMPDELKNKAVGFLKDEAENVYFIYEDIPGTDFEVMIYKAVSGQNQAMAKGSGRSGKESRDPFGADS